MTTLVASEAKVNSTSTAHPKYFVNIEGENKEWPRDTITTEEIAALGGWANEGVIEIDSNNVERTLTANEIIHLKPGMGFAKKVRWQRGDAGVFELRLLDELDHLKGYFKNAQQIRNWYLIPDYPLPEGWNLKAANIAFRVLDGYPGTPPYGFFVPVGLRFQGNLPGSYQEGIADVPPFEGQWGMFSWAPHEWRASDNVATGFNLLNFALSFAMRLKEGA